MAIFSGAIGLNSLRGVQGYIVVQAVLGQDEKNHHKPVFFLWVTEPLLKWRVGCC